MAHRFTRMADKTVIIEFVIDTRIYTTDKAVHDYINPQSQNISLKYIDINREIKEIDEELLSGNYSCIMQGSQYETDPDKGAPYHIILRFSDKEMDEESAALFASGMKHLITGNTIYKTAFRESTLEITTRTNALLRVVDEIVNSSPLGSATYGYDPTYKDYKKLVTVRREELGEFDFIDKYGILLPERP